MESTGTPGKIQVSHATAKCLRESGKEHWLKSREDVVSAKGKGVLNTFWANPSSRKKSSVASGDSASENYRIGEEDLQNLFKPSHKRHIDWMTELLLDLLKKMVSHFKIVLPTERCPCSLF